MVILTASPTRKKEAGMSVEKDSEQLSQPIQTWSNSNPFLDGLGKFCSPCVK